MAIYKGIPKSDTTLTKAKLHKIWTLNTGSQGLSSNQYISRSFTDASRKTMTDAHKYWHFLLFNFYLSGSHYSISESKFNSSYFSLGSNSTINPQYRNKFFTSGSFISIPQRYFGEEIKPGSFKLVDNSTAKEIIIKDDKYGNLYSSNAHASKSATTSISSSDNYVGNIFYNLGIATITDTGSWSGSINYTDVTTGNYIVKFGSTQTIYTREHTVRVKPREFNATSNITSRRLTSGSGRRSDVSQSASPYLLSKLTGSGWRPYMNTIGLYRHNETTPLFVARYSQPIKMSDDTEYVFKIRYDT